MYSSCTFFQEDHGVSGRVSCGMIGDSVSVAIDLSGAFGGYLSLHVKNIQQVFALADEIKRAASALAEDNKMRETETLAEVGA